jgi:hypothetical protein
LKGRLSWCSYFQPLQRNALKKDRLVELAQQHLAELVEIAESDLDMEVYETIGDFLELNEVAQAPWFACLKEACYAMAADYDLQRYFMSDYYRIRFDYSAYYELWIGGGKFFFDDGRCLVGPPAMALGSSAAVSGRTTAQKLKIEREVG